MMPVFWYRNCQNIVKNIIDVDQKEFRYWIQITSSKYIEIRNTFLIVMTCKICPSGAIFPSEVFCKKTFLWIAWMLQQGFNIIIFERNIDLTSNYDIFVFSFTIAHIVAFLFPKWFTNKTNWPLRVWFPAHNDSLLSILYIYI